MRKQKDDLKSSQKHPKKTQKRQNEASEDDSVREKVEDNIIKVQPDNEKTEESMSPFVFENKGKLYVMWWKLNPCKSGTQSQYKLPW